MIDMLGNIGQPKKMVVSQQNFAKLMEKGKVGPSLRLLQENNPGEILPLTHTTRKELQGKHLSAKVAALDTKIEGP